MKISRRFVKPTIGIVSALALGAAIASPVSATGGKDEAPSTTVAETSKPVETTTSKLKKSEVTDVDLDTGVKCQLSITNNGSIHSNVSVIVVVDGETVATAKDVESADTVNKTITYDETFEIEEGSEVKVYKTYEKNSSLDAKDISCTVAPTPIVPIPATPTFTG